MESLNAEGPCFGVVFNIPYDKVLSYRIDAKGEAAVGKRVMVPLGSRDAAGFVVSESPGPPEGLEGKALKQIRRVVDKEPLFDEETLDLAKWVAAYYFCSLGQALGAMLPSGRRAADTPGLAASEEMTASPLTLSEEQQDALDAIFAEEPREGGEVPQTIAEQVRAYQGGGVQQAITEQGLTHQGGSAQRSARGGGAEGDPAVTEKGNGNRPPSLFYLYGITGSGKTEVFLRAAERTLAEGKSVIYLVPEISLTHQTAEVIGKRFGSTAATMHSGMKSGARLAEWQRIRRGEARIVVGPRSAVFAPLRRLGLVIIDEEQDGSYKSGSAPRYHARQAAMHRCARTGARLLMGSATPSAEAWRMMQEGGIQRLNLTRRLAGGTLPSIRLVPLAGEGGVLSRGLKEEIRKTFLMGRQTILFLNRRGFAHFYRCPSCGFVLQCKRCSVSLTWHKAAGRASCHYCGYSAAPPAVCPQCGSLEAGFRGVGTELVEEEVRAAFPDLRIARADADTQGNAECLKETLDRFRAGELDLLLGTQMVAKGLNFPGVRLVGVVLADTGLQLPDFRAAERVFSLVVQVAGRSGRYFPDGLVIVQSFRPEDEAIRRSCALDVEGFFARELPQREALRFPPFTRLIRFTIRSKDAGRADRAIARLAELAAPLLPPGADVLGPAECPLSVLNGSHRRHLILRGPRMGPLHAAARAILKRCEQERDPKVFLEVDVDPVAVL
ncbi:MAG: primosomal protein N' [Treponema sp.]|jgi:primosomal protein N' (replication factor Y)|nr:primosomal protein N' [Treponema sp.]